MANNSKYLKNTKWTINKIESEVTRGLLLLNKIKKPIVTVLGSHKPKTKDDNYKHAKKLGYVLGKKGYAIVTGGGPGIMDAANKGAAQAGSDSIGIRAALLKNEKVRNQNLTGHVSYHFLFIRRFILSIKSDALIFYPGGYGTLNEFFEYVVLIQLAMMDRVPVVCVGRKYWKGLFDWLRSAPEKAGYFIDSDNDLGLVQFADSVEEIVKIIEDSKIKTKVQGKEEVKSKK